MKVLGKLGRTGLACLIAVFCGGILFSLPGEAVSGVQLVWAARYNGLANQLDQPTGLAVAASGNVYVTGYSQVTKYNTDWVTLKYNASGVRQWVKTYNNPANDHDKAYAIAVDQHGDIYVTGSSGGFIDAEKDMVTIKYDAAGNRIWLQKYNVDPLFTKTQGRAVAVDSQGNILVGGWVEGGFEKGYVIIKYNPQGAPLWLRRYKINPITYSSCHFRAMEVDSAGNVYLTGGYSAFITVKYNSMGTFQWARTYKGPSTRTDIATNMATALAVDKSGNVYVTGYSRNGPYPLREDLDYQTLKYSPAGVVLWSRRYKGPGNYDDQPSGIKVDGQGNVYVTGTSVVDYNDYATIKYSKDGNEEWIAWFDGTGLRNEMATSLALDGQGNIYVAGASEGPGQSPNFDYAIVKYSPVGVPLGTARYNGPANKNDIPAAMVLDSQGNIYVTGASESSASDYTGSGKDFATVKFRQY